ncbi:GntR family transcriptional regulator [Flavimaricola marinus]|uniref:HTH-type transcriptional repressor YvoA n=1 Tax=Flavimaricola marinus TaxID=1819565 RepID=A0A238LJX7_9RHOB|nr:GntR family transcriptional regulator [Flavimaricola marinus]SMY09843.1 HTH-type transcriptional repressor YvoA [Flavimaricola marinus]
MPKELSELQSSTPSRGVIERRAEALIRRLLPEIGMSPGDKIPSERDLAERFGISRMTVRKAIDHMVDLGQLERRGTAGTFIPEVAVVRPLSKRISTAISEVVGQRGKLPGSKLLFFEQASADAHVARRLRLENGDGVIVIKRLRLSDSVPFCVEISYLPLESVPGLVAADLMDAPSLYALLRDRYGMTFAKSDFQVTVGAAPEAEATLLGIAVDAPTLLMRSLVYDVTDRPVEYLISWNHPDRVAFESYRYDGNPITSVYTDWTRPTKGEAAGPPSGVADRQ